MPLNLTSLQFPWHERSGRMLHENLVQVFPVVQDAIQLARQAGLNVYQINSSKAIYYVWIEILDKATGLGLTRRLIQEVKDTLYKEHPLQQFLSALLDGGEAPLDSQQVTRDGAPAFISSNDQVSQLEALLYQDDLTIQTGRLLSLIKTLEKMMALVPAVCKLEVSIHGESQVGTAFLVGEEWLLTNWHVLHRIRDKVAATAVTAIFGYEEDESGAMGASEEVRCLVETIVSEEDDDWAIIKISAPQTGRPVIDVNNVTLPDVNAPAYIIQHPLGNRKRLGFVRNQITDMNERVIHYLTDTQEGSSGAPVFSAEGHLIALHHAGGRPQQITGRPPLKKNEGIRISRIMDRLRSKGLHMI